jgi:hypothetical protein
MRGDVVFRVYGVHDGRVDDRSSGTFRTRAAAEAEIEDLLSREVGGENWARRYRNGGFVIRDQVVSTDFDIPPRPSPRDSYVVSTSPKPNETGWDSTIVEVRRRSSLGEHQPVCSYERDHAMFQTFEPFRQGDRDLALISRHYTTTAVLDLASGEVIAEEDEQDPGGGFCPVGFYVPDWWDVHDGRTIPGSEHWDVDNEWPTGDFGFVWGCHWGDDSGWKVQYLDLSRVRDGVITRDARFGYTKLATAGYLSPCFLLDRQEDERVGHPPFIDISAYSGRARVTLSTEVAFNLDGGATLPEELDYDRATGELIARDDD